MIIREYAPADERGWVRCRAAAFLDCSYYDDVRTEKETYLQPSICLVAETDGRIAGLIDVELDSYDLACAGDERGAVLWNLAVLPEYRRAGVARQLWQAMKNRLAGEGVRHCEVWTQQDEAANGFYRSMGFTQEHAHTWLRCHANITGIERALKPEFSEGIFGVEELVFNAPVARLNELAPLCQRIDEVRLYSIRF